MTEQRASAVASAIRRLHQFLYFYREDLRGLLEEYQDAYGDRPFDHLAELRVTAIEAGFSISDLARYDR